MTKAGIILKQEKGDNKTVENRTVTLNLGAWYLSAVTKKGFFGQLLRRMRRGFFGVFRKDYIQKSVAETRQGDCHRCGSCCQLIYRCPFLGRDGQNLPYCRIYGDLRPANCHVYPFDKIDSEVENCGFTFK